MTRQPKLIRLIEHSTVAVTTTRLRPLFGLSEQDFQPKTDTVVRHVAKLNYMPNDIAGHRSSHVRFKIVWPIQNSNSSGDEIANVNFYAVRPEATRIRWNNPNYAITLLKVIQGHRFWYQSKAHIRFPISD